VIAATASEPIRPETEREERRGGVAIAQAAIDISPAPSRGALLS
jgi:hypothetical protein